MLRLLFGRGPWVWWYILMYATLAIGVLLPTLAFLPLKKPGEKPDTPSLGSVFFVMWMACALAGVTAVNAGIFSRALQAHLVYKLLLVLAAAAVVAVGAYWASAWMATEQSRRAMAVWSGTAAALVLGNLWLAWFGTNRPPASVRAPGEWVVWALLVVAALPAIYFAFMIVMGFILMGLEKIRR